MTRARLGLVATVAIVAVGTLASCAQVPDQGPVVVARERGSAPPPVGQYNQPKGPQSGDTPADIVNGFLEAMTATPLQTTTAQQFLAGPAQDQWQPRRVVTYTSHTAPEGNARVRVSVRGADQIGTRGQWRGPVAPAARHLDFPMTRENGEWRIASAPDALIVPRSFFDQQYEDAQIYFFDPTGQILVPEPVHVPQGSQLASALVKALLRGPAGSLDGVERSFFPPGLSVRLSVAVDRNLAEVSLKGPDPGPLSEQTVQQMLAQLAWTLRQDPSVSAFTLTMGNRAVTDATGEKRFPVRSREFESYDPAWEKATLVTYALRRGRLVSGQVNRLTKVDGPFGTKDLGIGPFAVSLDGYTVAATGQDNLRVGPVLGDEQPVVMQSGTGLLRPAWDFAKRLWEVQNGVDGASVGYVAGGDQHNVRVRGVTGETVHRFLVSRDGSRLVAVVRGTNRDRIVVSRIRYDADGMVAGTSRAEPIGWKSRGTKRIRDIGWTSPTTIAVLDQLSQEQAEVRILNVDGSTRPGRVSPIGIRGDVPYLATSPAGQQTPYAVQTSRSSGLALADISPAESNRTLTIDGLRHVTYAG